MTVQKAKLNLKMAKGLEMAAKILIKMIFKEEEESDCVNDISIYSKMVDD